jgi:hypothetical protein
VEISSAFTCIAFVIVTLRLYTRFYLIRCAGLEDFGIALAMVRGPIRSTTFLANISQSYALLVSQYVLVLVRMIRSLLGIIVNTTQKQGMEWANTNLRLPTTSLSRAER